MGDFEICSAFSNWRERDCSYAINRDITEYYKLAIYYRKYILQITQPFQYRYTQLQYRFAVISKAPSSTLDPVRGSLSLSLSASLCLSVSLCVCVCVSLSLPPYRPLPLSVSVSLALSLYLSIYILLCISISLFISLSLSFLIFQFIFQFTVFRPLPHGEQEVWYLYGVWLHRQ